MSVRCLCLKEVKIDLKPAGLQIIIKAIPIVIVISCIE